MKPNKYDYYLIFLFLILAFGAYGGAFQPIRLFAILFFIYYFPLILREIKLYKVQIYFLLGISLYGAASVFFTLGNIKESFISYIYLIINLMIYSIIFTFYKNSNFKLKSIVNGVYIFLGIALLFSVYEISTGNHLSMNIDHGVESLISREYSSFTFGNYNTYVMVLVMMLPLLIFSILKYNFMYRVLGVFLFSIMAYVILINGSRTGAFLILLSFLFLILHKGKSLVLNSIVKITVICGGLYLLFNNLYILDTLVLRYENSGLESSDRLENLFLPLGGLLASLLLGFGIGNYKYYMLENYPNKMIIAPHNFFGEMLYELGLFGFLLLIFLLSSMTIRVILGKGENKFVFYFYWWFFHFFA